MTFEKRRTLLMGARGLVMPVPKFLSDRGLAKGVAGARAKAARLTADERRVHHYIVRAMATAKSPIEARMVSDALLLPHDMVLETIDKLEELKTFLYRSGGQGVDWAYPLSLEDTGHEMRCSTGERFNAAWAIDALATPFVQGRLQNRELDYTIHSSCANSGRPITIGIDSELKIKEVAEDADVMYSMALVNTDRMREKSIIDVFWRQSLFFWSEEDAREFQKRTRKTRFYMNVTPVSLDGIRRIQAALFDF